MKKPPESAGGFEQRSNYLLLLFFCDDLAESFFTELVPEVLEVEGLLELHPHVIVFLLNMLMLILPL